MRMPVLSNCGSMASRTSARGTGSPPAGAQRRPTSFSSSRPAAAQSSADTTSRSTT